jgi:hypothetical protein
MEESERVELGAKLKEKCGLEITTLFLLPLGTFSQIKQT